MMKQKHWQDLSPLEKILIVILALIQLSLLAAALWDLRQRSPQELNGSKEMWAVVSFVNFFGPIFYFLFGIKRGQLPAGGQVSAIR